MALAEPASSAEARFNSVRKRLWFAPAKAALITMSGASRTCMFCDHSEPTDVEHFKPKTEFPNDTFDWDNMLWICTACNRHKGTRFPPHNCVGQQIINPATEIVWDYFFLDSYGNLIKKWDAALNDYNPRASSTCIYAKIDRDEIQIRRRKRMKTLIIAVSQAIDDMQNHRATIADLNNRAADWFAEPFQADIADYYLRGPGAVEKPFVDFLGLGVTLPAV